MNILIGADPEFFVEDKNGEVIPAHGMINGNKANPVACPGGAMQVDGLALEFNIEPAKNRDEFVSRILTVKEATINAARINTGMHDLSISTRLLKVFPHKILRELPREAVELGCSPDYSGIDGKPKTGNGGPKGNIRVVGGHVHIGWGKDLDVSHGSSHFFDCCLFSNMLELLLFPKIVKTCINEGIMDRVDQQEGLRRKRYGSLSSFRPKPYGMEYRGLSNAWIHSPAVAREVYDTVIAVYAYLSGRGGKSSKKLLGKVDAIRNKVNRFDYMSRCSVPAASFTSYFDYSGVEEIAEGFSATYMKLHGKSFY